MLPKNLDNSAHVFYFQVQESVNLSFLFDFTFERSPFKRKGKGEGEDCPLRCSGLKNSMAVQSMESQSRTLHFTWIPSRPESETKDNIKYVLLCDNGLFVSPKVSSQDGCSRSFCLYLFSHSIFSSLKPSTVISAVYLNVCFQLSLLNSM